MFNPFIQICSTRTARVRSCATNQPVMPYSPMAAGADHTRIAM